MRLAALNLENFRNIEVASLQFSGDRVFLLGPNGQGKTNLLEAIGLSSSLRSFRKTGTQDMVLEGKDQSRLFYRFEDDEGKDRDTLLSFGLRGPKTLEVDGNKISRLGDFLGEFPSVVLSSRDFRFLRDGPSERRKWLDLLLSSSEQEYFAVLQTFHGALRERNALLRRGGGDREIDAFEQTLIPAAVLLQTMRLEAMPALSAILAESYASLSGAKEEARLEYKPDILLENEAEWSRRLQEERSRDRVVGNTRRGPHRDDFSVLLDSRDARSFASEGQEKGLVLSLRLAEFSFLREARGRVPILIADDVLGELDAERESNFKKLLAPEAQVFASGTVFPSGEEEKDWEVFDVSAGAFAKS